MASRRTFLQGGAALAAGVAATGSHAIAPIQRNGQTHIRLSLAGYSYRNLLNNGKGPMTLLDLADIAAELNLDGIEPTSYYFPPDFTADFVLNLKRHCHLLGLDITGVPIRSVFTMPPGEQRQKEIDHCKRWIDWAALLGAPTIRVFAGKLQEGSNLREARNWTVDAMKEALDYAGEKGVFLALENHGGIVSDADGVLALVRAIDHPWFGVNLDTGNFHSKDPYEEIARCAPYAVMVQYKVSIRPENGEKQPADFRRILDILEAVDYRGYVALEYEDKDDPNAGVPPAIRTMQRILNA